jgi:hypothetical protein
MIISIASVIFVLFLVGILGQEGNLMHVTQIAWLEF